MLIRLPGLIAPKTKRPPVRPELNPVEHVWDALREKYFHNLAFDSMEALEDQLEARLRAFELGHSRIQSIVR